MPVTPEEAQAPLRALPKGAHVHMIGVAGAGMNALAAILLARGFAVSGSDQQRTPTIDRLIEHGLVFNLGHDATQVSGARLVIMSAAVRDSNVELAAARLARIPVVKRAVALGWLLDGKATIAVAGTHGKTTTSAMLAVILTRAGFDPTFVVGGEVSDLAASAGVGTGDWAVVEADEYDRSFLQLRPTVAVITNVEPDHLEYYGTVDAMHQAYAQFIGRMQSGGTMVLNGQDECLSSLVAPDGMRVVRCAIDRADADWRATSIREDGDGSRFRVTWPQGELDTQLPLSGRHNILNALEALAAASAAGVDMAAAADALASFHGTGRRFEVLGEAAGVLVVDDYAHHPTEIRATLAAARARYANRRLVVVFQPHTYSRTKLLFDDFVTAFGGADLLLLTDIYAAREADTLGMDADQLAAAIGARIGASRVLRAREVGDVTTTLTPYLRPRDVVFTLGAGTITEVGPRLLAALHAAGTCT
ncbi:MAG: UDP-N-acetylmuramate--L-alanine ligase [Chloroflexi bacterium]|nr:UDP-N-acetylmuramate--L-alanine ligase [Chloroflexota bacterium]